MCLICIHGFWTLDLLPRPYLFKLGMSRQWELTARIKHQDMFVYTWATLVFKSTVIHGQEACSVISTNGANFSRHVVATYNIHSWSCCHIHRPFANFVFRESSAIFRLCNFHQRFFIRTFQGHRMSLTCNSVIFFWTKILHAAFNLRTESSDPRTSRWQMSLNVLLTGFFKV